MTTRPPGATLAVPTRAALTVYESVNATLPSTRYGTGRSLPRSCATHRGDVGLGVVALAGEDPALALVVEDAVGGDPADDRGDAGVALEERGDVGPARIGEHVEPGELLNRAGRGGDQRRLLGVECAAGDPAAGGEHRRRSEGYLARLVPIRLSAASTPLSVPHFLVIAGVSSSRTFFSSRSLTAGGSSLFWFLGSLISLTNAWLASM